MPHSASFRRAVEWNQGSKMSLTLFTLLLLGLLTNLICPFSVTFYSHVFVFFLFASLFLNVANHHAPCSFFASLFWLHSSLPLWLGSLSPWTLISSFIEFFCSLSLYVHLVIAQSQDPSICDASVEAIDEYWCYKYMFECVFASIYFLCIFAFHLFSL